MLDSKIHELIQEYKRDKAANIHKVRKAVRQEQEIAKRNKELEEDAWADFVATNKGKRFVHLEDIDGLNLEYDVLLFVSNKNIGKTTNIIYNRFRYYRDKGQKVIFGRVTKDELKGSASSYQESSNCPFNFKTKEAGLYMYDKETDEETGRCVSFRQCNSISAGEFENYGAIIFDEIFTWNPINLVNTSTLQNFFAFPSSIQRNKEEKIKIYLLGNNTGSNDSLLNALGIHPDDDLRYIIRPNPDNPTKVCKILYINARDIYRGIADQDGAAQMANQQAKFALNTNAPLEYNLNKTKKDLHDKLPYKFCFVINVVTGLSVLQQKRPGCGILKFEVRGFPHVDLNYSVEVNKFDPTIPCDGPVFVECPALVAKFGSYVTKVNTIEVYKEQLYLMMLQNKLDFVSADSYECCYYLYTEIEKLKKYLI